MEEEIIYKVEVQGITSIESLTKANKELREERKKLDLDTAEGQKRVQAINAQLDANTNKIKENVSALEKQRLNIGNYQSALDRVIPGFSGFTQGIQSATTASKALIATPLGAILAAVAVVLGVVVAALKKSEPVLDFFENIITQITANIDFLLTNLDKLGSILYDLATFNISGAIDKVKGLTQEMIAVARAAQLYLDILRELEDEQALFTVSSAQQENQIKALVIASKNRNLTFDEQKEKIQEALKLERELTEQRIDLARKEEVATIKQIALSRGLRQTEEENFDAFVERLLRGNELSGEEKQQVADLSAARIKAESESLAFREKAANMIAAIDDKETAANEKRIAQSQKEQEELMKKVALMNDVSNTEDTLLTREVERNEIKLQVQSNFNESISKINKKFTDEEIKRKQQESKNFEIAEGQKLQTQRIVLNGLTQGLRAFGIESKLINSALAVANTFLGVTEILKAPTAPFVEPFASVVRGVQIATTLATGLGAVAKINNVSFAAGGGNFITKGPTMLMVGDNPGGVERVTVEPISGRGQTKVSGNLIQMAGGGSLTTVGSAANRSESSLSMTNLMDQLASIQFVVTVEDINVAQNRVSEFTNRAKIQ